MRDTNNQEVAELKKEVRTLKRQLARANREIARLQGTTEEKVEPEAKAPDPAVAVCPKCGSTSLGEIQTPSGKTVQSCRACKKWRGPAG
jgi:hypothetical protein